MASKSTYNKEDGETICAALAEGHSLLSICEAMGIAHSTASDWERDIPEHSANSTRAREIGYRVLSEQCLQIADTPLIGEERTTKADGSIEIREGDMLGHRKLQIDTRLRLLGKWAPKVYGDKLALGGADDLPAIKTNRPLSEMSTDEIRAALAQLGRETR